jgi:hypothetical protein
VRGAGDVTRERRTSFRGRPPVNRRKIPLRSILNCKDAARLISRELDGQLPFGRRLLLRFHLFWCDACGDFARQAMFLREAMRRYRS